MLSSDDAWGHGLFRVRNTDCHLMRSCVIELGPSLTFSIRAGAFRVIAALITASSAILWSDVGAMQSRVQWHHEMMFSTTGDGITCEWTTVTTLRGKSWQRPQVCETIIVVVVLWVFLAILLVVATHSFCIV